MEKFNIIPSPTWNRLGVNCAEESAGIPEAFDSVGASVITACPEGLEVGDDAPIACEELKSSTGFDEIIENNEAFSFNATVEDKYAHPLVINTEDAAVVGNIYAVEGAELTILHVLRGSSEALTRVYAEKGARVNVVEVSFAEIDNIRYSAFASYCEEGAEVRFTRCELGGNRVVCGSKAVLQGNSSAYDFAGCYFGEGEAVLDFNDLSEHYGRDTLCEMHSAGALSGSADKILRGTINFKKGAKRGIGHESEDVILLSPDVRDRTAPLILCHEEEVEGQHAASHGRLDETALYYLMSRGIPEAQARSLMVEARFARAIDRIPDETIREEALTTVRRRLQNA